MKCHIHVSSEKAEIISSRKGQEKLHWNISDDLWRMGMIWNWKMKGKCTQVEGLAWTMDLREAKHWNQDIFQSGWKRGRKAFNAGGKY